MIDHLIVALLGTFALGLATWHVARVVATSVLFEPLRDWLEYHCSHWETGCASRWCAALRVWWDGFQCRLCLGTQVAIALTWGTLAVGLLVERSLLPIAEWGFAFAVGPFLTGAWAEIIRRSERIEVPD